MEIVIIVIAFALIVLFYYQSSLRAKKKEAFRQSNYEKVNALLPEIENHVISFKQFAQFDSGYFNHLKLKIWKNGSKKTYAAITNLPYNSIELPFQKLELIETFVNYYSNGGVVRKSYNGRFVKHELTIYKRFFDNIDGQKLDTQQRTAIVTDEDNNIVVAGAGSGKTTTVVGKVSYIVERYKIKPEEILLISFTRNAAEEMNKRIKKKMKIDIDTMTFHKLGLDIIASATDEKPSVFEEKKLTGLIEGFISAEKKDLNYLSKMNNFFINFLKPYKSESEFKNHGDYIQYIKDTNFKSYKQLSYNIKGRQTLLREPCKSMEEVIIANFLYLNNINYEYEKVYQYNTATKNHAQYKPDFYLPDFDIYIEHFGIDRNGNVPKWFDDNHYEDANEKYKLGIKWKRETHKKYKTTLIETFSYEKTEGELLLNLEKKLKLNRVVVKPKSSTEVAEIISKVAPEEINNFNQLVITFLTLLKSNNYSIADIKKKNNFSKGGLEKQRNEAFLELFIPLFNKYQNHLSSEKEIDFSDMINHATEYISSQQVSRPYKYIIIDEFQDTSIGRYGLVKAILNSSPDCKLFCVGDDWQSIYRFSGSDISIFTEFEKHFGVSSQTFIETTYRFNSSLIKTSSEFIMKNPNQVSKKLQSFKSEDFIPYQINYSDSILNNDTSPVVEAFKTIITENLDEKSESEILLLGRYSHDINFLKEDKKNFVVKWNQTENVYDVTFLEFQSFKIKFLTIHRAKGLQADYTIILNCSAGKYGFPSEQADDPVLNLLLTQADQFPNGEERRLFYVALTRCKYKVFLIANIKYKSKFVVELEENNPDNNAKKCPVCQTGNVMEKSGVSENGYNWTKYYCSNWNMGCDYIDWLN